MRLYIRGEDSYRHMAGGSTPPRHRGIGLELGGERTTKGLSGDDEGDHDVVMGIGDCNNS